MQIRCIFTLLSTVTTYAKEDKEILEFTDILD